MVLNAARSRLMVGLTAPDKVDLTFTCRASPFKRTRRFFIPRWRRPRHVDSTYPSIASRCCRRRRRSARLTSTSGGWPSPTMRSACGLAGRRRDWHRARGPRADTGRDRWRSGRPDRTANHRPLQARAPSGATDSASGLSGNSLTWIRANGCGCSDGRHFSCRDSDGTRRRRRRGWRSRRHSARIRARVESGTRCD